MRCFIAVDLDEALKPGIADLQRQLAGLDVNLIPSNSLHFTLKFLGAVTDTDISRLKVTLSQLVSSTKPFDIDLRGAGVFPGEQYMNVLWIGAPADEFVNLHRAVAEKTRNYMKTEKPIPHLTIARIKSPRHKAQILDFVKANKTGYFGSMPVNKIVLKKSTLTWDGPIYEDVAAFELAK